MCTMKAMLILTSLLVSHTMAEKELGEGKEGTCLLSQKSMLATTLGMQAKVHRNWRNQHAMQRKALQEKEDILDKFISKQKAAGTACSARLMESKRALDGLLADVKKLSTQVDGHEAVLETENDNLNITKLTIASVESAYDDAVAECEKQKKEALEDLKQYTAELKELTEIANPKARYAEAKLGLLEMGAFTRERCVAFLQFAQRHKGRGFQPTKVEPRACDEQREELQKAFTKAYKDIADLMKDAKERSVDKTCFEDAAAEKTSKLVPLTAQREQCVERITAATDAISALTPVLDTTKTRTERLQEHIDEALVPECFEASEVSETLMKVRELILLVEECPGRDDFTLKIPKPPAPKPPAPLPAAKAAEVIEKAKEDVEEKKEAVADAVEEKKEDIADAVEEKKEAVEEKKEAVADAVEEKKEAVADAVEEKKDAVEDAVEEKKEAVADAVEEAAEPEAAAAPAPAEPAAAEPEVAEPETSAEPEEATEPPAVEPESVAEPEEATEPEAAKEAPAAEAPAETKKEPEKEAAAPAAEGNNNNDDNGDYYTYYEAGSLAQKKTKRRVRKHQPTK